MTKQEFEQRYGKEVSEQVFDNINDLYMGAGNMDKDTFVKDYKKHEESMLLQMYFEKSKTQAKMIRNLKQQISYLVDTIIKEGSASLNNELLIVAQEAIGVKDYILRKIALKIELEDDDLEYISKNLK